MKAETKSDEQVIEEIVGRKVSDLDKKIDGIKEMISKPKEETVSGVLAKIKDKVPEQAIVKEVKHDHDIFCPTCGDGHIHKLGGSSSGLTVKCTGDKCGEEFVLVPKKSDYKCTTCGLPLKKPEEGSKHKVESCPMCGNLRSIEFNLEELKKQDRYRKV